MAKDFDIAAGVNDGDITANKLADSAVTTAKISNGSINSDKIASGNLAADAFVGDGSQLTGVIPSDGSVTAAKIADDAVTTAKIATGAVTSDKIDSSAIDGLMPAGAVQNFAMPSAPTGWLKANGAALSRTVYANLFSAIGTSFGAGDGSTTFNLPDLRGEFIRGWDDARGVDGGRGFASNQAARTGSAGLEDFMEIRIPYAYGNLNMNVFAPKGGVHPNYGGSTGGYRAALTATNIGETRPRNVALLYCIKY